MRKAFLLTLAGLLLIGQAFAQEEQEENKDKKKLVTLNTLRLDTRADYTYDYHCADSSSNHGLQGKYLQITLDGNITDKFSYHLRQRINSPNSSFANTFFQGTDWAYLNWFITDNFFISAGKQVVAIGGWEYDAAPIDIYYGTDFWNHVCCYEMGVSANYKDHSGRNHFLFQFSNSPAITQSLQGIYAYNLMWYGNLGHFSTAYSVNMLQNTEKQFVNYISLGNKIVFDNFEVRLDLQNRASSKNTRFLAENYTILLGAGLNIGQKWIIFAKGGYDHNSTDIIDLYNPLGGDVHFESAGFEFYPLSSRNLRLHFCGTHTNTDGTHNFQGNIGLTWKVDLLHAFIKK